MMASQMVVEPSVDTLFMRGFSAKQDIQKIREFFEHETGGCSVEFFKESDDREMLFVALRFDTKDIAKDVLNKYDNGDVLGDRVTITWFRDLRRARQKGMEMNGYYHRGGYHRGNFRGNFGFRGRGRRYMHGNRHYYPRYHRSYDRSVSRSRSRSPRSYSRSRSRSVGRRRSRSYRSHSRSRSFDRSKSHVSQHSKSRSRTPEKKKVKKRKSRKISKERHEEETTRGNYEDVPDELWEEEHTRAKGDPQSPGSPSHKASKHLRSAVKTVGKENRESADYSDEDQAAYEPEGYYMKDMAAFKSKRRSASPMSEDVSGEALLEQAFERKKPSKDSKRTRNNEDEGQQYVQEQESKLEKKRKKYMEEMEHSALFASEVNDKGRAASKREQSPVDNGDVPPLNGDLVLDRGALGLSHDKMALVREKKDEIERAYRQDCETFSAVVKMLISKNAELEDLLRDSLKDNLKDIGQRCIQELKEFIEGVKVHDLT